MKLTNHEGLRASGWLCLLLIELCLMVFGSVVQAQSLSTTTVQGTVYLANGQPGTGTLMVSWPSFSTASGQVVAADSMTLAIAPDGYVSVSLAPNQGATPAGLYYTAIFYMSDGTVNTQYWVVPAGTSATLGQVQAQLMPSTQAVQAASKTYVDQAVAALAGGTLTISGTTMTGPLTLCCDPATPLQAADKHYVDAATAQEVPLTGGTLTGPLTATKLGALYQVDQFAGADFGAKLGACLSGLSTTQGGTCDARNFTGSLSMGSNLTISTANAVVLLPCATISTANQVVVTAGTRNVSLRGCALRGASTASGSQGGTVFFYSGTGAMVQVGDPTYAADTQGFHLDNVVINTTLSSSAGAQGLAAYRTQELDLESLYFLGNSNQTGMTLDGTGNYTGGTFYDNDISGYQTAVNAIGHQIANPATTDWLNASTFVRLHIDCPTSGGNPISGTYGINLQQGDGNTFTGGDVEGCSTALHLGSNAQNNTIVGLRNENSTNQVVADAGSSYNNWMTGGTMFTGQLTDNGTRNSFLDTFHRSFNGLNGDWYGSQKDATVTNHIRLGIGLGNERGLVNEIQTDYGYRWLYGFTDATAGEQFYQIQDLLNNVGRLAIGQYNNGQSSTNNQTVINSAGTGAVVLNGSTNAGTGGVVIGSGGASETTVATISNAGNAQFNGTLQVGGTSQSTGTMTVRNNADAEVDYYLWPGLTTSQKGSYTYKDWNGNSQWYMVKDQYNNWALNSATGGLDSFKAYQSTNSGDTYIDTSNSTGVVRINYETGSGTQFKVYGGSSSSLYASFTGTTTIQFPGLAANSGHNCLQIDNSGYITNTGTACGSGSSNGTVNSGTSGQIAYYNGTGTALSGTSTVSVTAGGTGSSTASGALTNLGGAALTGASFTGPVSTSGILSAANNASIGPRYDVTNSTFGAKGDGSTDDTAAIQAAFNACYNGGVVPYGGVVEFPGRHTYNVSATINAYDSCRIEGVTGSVSTPGAPPRLAWNGAAAGAVSTITSFSITSNVVTFTAANSLIAGQYVDIEGLTAGYYLNRSIMQVSSTGLSSSQFTATLPFGWSNVTTTTDSGTATTVNVLLAYDSNARYQQSISNMELLPASTATPGSLQVDAYYGSRVDTGTQILNTWAEGATMYGYYFANGGINAYFDQGWRCDGVGISCIYWRVSSTDSLGISNGTVDNSSSGSNSGGAVMLDAAACANQTGIHFTSKNMKFEINNSLSTGLGVFTMYDCPSNSNMEAFWLDLENNWVSPGSISTAGFNFPSFVMSPANDAALSLTIVNGGFPEGVSPNTTTRWVGLPAILRNDMYNISSTIPYLSYAPSINSAGLYRAYNAPISLLGDVNLSQVWHYGIRASDYLYSDTAFAALPNATTLYAGQILAPPAYWNGASGKRYAIDVVYQTGTTGTPNSGSTTCTGSSGSYVLTCTSATDLSAGQRITIGTDANKVINYVDATKPSAVLVNLGSSLGSTYSTATALSFSAPVLGPEIQMPTKSSAAPATLAWLEGDMLQNSGATANGVAAWVNVAAGTPGTWAGIPLGNSSGQITSSQIAPASLQGTDTKVLTAGTVSGTASPLCTDSNGGATTTGCPSATLPSTAVQTNQANTYSTGLQDFSAASMKQPSTYTVGSNTITNPTSTGTLALTSQLSAYAALSGAVFTGAVNGIQFTNPSASDACVEISARMAALPVGGGIVDARGMNGGTCAATLTINKPVHLELGVGTFTFSGNPGINVASGGFVVEGSGCSLGEVGTLLKSGAAGPLIADTTSGADRLQVKNLCLDGNSGQGLWGGFAPYGAGNNYENVVAKNFAYQGILSTQGVGTFLNVYTSGNGEGFMLASDTSFGGQSEAETNSPGSGLHVISGGNFINCQSCDNNGYYGIYVDGRAWSDWAASTTYTPYQIIVPTTGNTGGYAFEATSAGTSGSSRPTFPQTPGAVSATDGGVKWANIGVEFASNSVSNNHLTNNYVDDNGVSGAGGNVRIEGNATTLAQPEYVTSLHTSQAVQTTRPIRALELVYVQQGAVSDVNWIGSNYGGSGADIGGLLIQNSNQVEVSNFTAINSAVTPLSITGSNDVHIKGATVENVASTGTATASQYCASIDSNSYRVTLDDLDCVSGSNHNMRGIINAGAETAVSNYKNYTYSGIDTYTASPQIIVADVGGNQSVAVNGSYANANGTVIPKTILGQEGPAAGYMLSAPTPSVGCYQYNGSAYVWGLCNSPIEVKNLVPDSDIKFGTTYWTLGSNTTIANKQGVGGTNAIQLATGGGNSDITKSLAFNLVCGQTYTLSGYINAASVSSGTVGWQVFNPGISTQYAAASQSAGTSGQVSATFTFSPSGCTAGTTSQVVVVTNNNSATYSGNIYFSAPMLEAGSTVTAYLPNVADDDTGTLLYGAMPSVIQNAIPSTATGYHGTGAGDVKVQLSDGTGTSGYVAVYDATGGLTNGSGIPASANALSSNSSSQFVASTSHNLSVPANCIAASGSGTAYTCTTSPTFTPATGDHIQFKADVANTGSATLNVNSAGAAPIYKWGNTSTLVAGDLQAGHWISATYDGSHWQLEGQLGNANATQLNSASIPASANVTSTNSSSQIVASTTHNLSVPANCIAASGSGTAYTCSTSPTFTPAIGDHIQFKADVANTGSATLAVNGATAATFKKWGGSGNLIANDLLAGNWISATFDGTYWQLEGQLGNANATQINGTAISGMSGSGSVLALTASPTFTGNTTTFANNSASTDYVVIQPGTSSTAYLGGIQLNSAAATPVTEWYIEEDTLYDLKIHDQGATTPVDILTGYINAGTNINSQGTSAVTINNSSTGSGTGGLVVYEGGANYNITAFAVNSSGNASMPGTLTAGGIITGGMGASLSSATSIAATSFTSTGLALPSIPVSTTKRGMCVLIWEQNTAVGTVQFGIGMNNAPTDLWVINQDSPGAYKAPTYTTIASTTTTAVSAADAPSATATGYRDEIEFTLTTGSSNAVTVTVYGLSSSTSDALVIEPGSYCTWLP
jgi:hypothetical protein